MVGKCSHYASLLCLLILLLNRKVGGALFDMGGQAFPGILTGKKKLPEIALAAIHKSSSSRRKAKENEPRFERQNRPPETRSLESPRARLY